MEILTRLRRDPIGVCQTYGISTGPEPGSFRGTEQGGACQINEKYEGMDVYSLTATQGMGTDYFFPWLQRSYSYVRVPKAVPDGTIVMTGGLNGCSLIVSDDGDDYVFYHDGDSAYLPRGSLNILGSEIVRITENQYDPENETQNIFTGFLSSYSKAGLAPPKGSLGYCIYVLFVKVNGQFMACSSPLITLGRASAIKGRHILSFPAR